MKITALRLAALSLAFSMTLAPVGAADRTQFRDPAGRGSLFGGALPDDDFGLRVEWTRDLGSGYSNVWIEGDTAVTMFAADTVDVVAALELATGNELWRYELGAKYEGHDGSDDGPIGTPTVADGTVYALGPSGQLVALNLADGSEKWRRVLDEQSSTVPFYGYTASPVIAGSNVIVATGGEGHAVTAFDRDSGETAWSSGDDSVSYQTPMLAELGGRELLLAVTDRLLQGLDPASGQLLWELQHTEGNQTEQSAHPTVVDDESFLVKYGRGARLYRLAGDGVEQVWETRAFGNTYALPVLIDDHFYGFTGAVLTCASADSGEIVWRSREPGGLGLSNVDGKLAIVSPQGELVLVDPSPEGYREITRVPLFEEGDYATPSFSNGLFVARNLQQLAAVRVDSSVAPQAMEIDQATRLQGEFGKWVASVEAMSERKRQDAVDQRFAGIETTPIVGEESLAHLVWRGEAEDVGANGDIAGPGQEVALFHVEGTDLFYRSLELDPNGQYAYNFIVDFGDPALDPGNPHSVDNGFGVASELRMPGWPASPHLEEPAEDAPRGTLDRFPFRSLILDNTREIQVWRPADYGQDAAMRYPVLVVNHGDNLLRGGLMQNTLDNLVGKSVAPLIAVFVPRANPPEYGGENGNDYTRFLVDELLPHIDRHYLSDGSRRAIMGPGSAGVAAVSAALSRPEVFQQAATQSFYPIAPAEDRLPELIAADGPKPELVYVVWSRRDYDLGDDRKADEASRELIAQLREGKVTVVEQIADYSPGWGGWRGQDDEILSTLFPLVTEE